MSKNKIQRKDENRQWNMNLKIKMKVK